MQYNVTSLANIDALFQVCFTGVNSVSGKMAETNFNETFGAQSALFVRCDVTNEMEFQGLFSLPVCKVDALLYCPVFLHQCISNNIAGR